MIDDENKVDKEKQHRHKIVSKDLRLIAIVLALTCA